MCRPCVGGVHGPWRWPGDGRWPWMATTIERFHSSRLWRTSAKGRLVLLQYRGVCCTTDSASAMSTSVVPISEKQASDLGAQRKLSLSGKEDDQDGVQRNISFRRVAKKMSKQKTQAADNLHAVLNTFRLRDHEGAGRKRSIAELDQGRPVASATNADEEARHYSNYCPLLPNSNIRRVIDICLLACVLYDSIFIPIRVAFENLNDMWPAQVYLETFVDVFFIIDCVSYFFTAYVAKDGKLEVRVAFIVPNYLKTSFLFNFVCSFPFEVIEAVINSPDTNLEVFGILRILRIARLLRVVGRLSRFSKIAETLVGNIRYTRWGLLMRIVTVFMFVVFLLHFIACYWLFVVTGWERDGPDNWLRHQDHKNIEFDMINSDVHSAAHVYLLSLSVALDMILGEAVETYTSIQRVNVVFFQLLGVSVVATVFGQFGSMMNDWNKRESHWHNAMMERCAMMNYMNLPDETQYRVRKYYEYQREQTEHGFVSKELAQDFIATLSKPLQNEILLYMHRKELGEISIFAECPGDAIGSIVRDIQLQIYLPGDIVVNKGDMGNTFYLITQGRCEVLDDQDDVIATLKAGDHFGEGCLMDGLPYEATVRAKTYCNFNILQKSSFTKVLKEHPEYQAILHRAIEKAKVESDNVINQQVLSHSQDKLRRQSGILSLKPQPPKSGKPKQPVSSRHEAAWE